MRKILLASLSIALMAAQCNQCTCSFVWEKESLAAGWCTLTIKECNGDTETFAVDEVTYNSYNVGDCYP